MQKMMFNDKYGLTEAVLNGRKYLTRRIAIFPKTCYGGIDEEKMVTWDCGGNEISINSKYKIGEVVAVAQSYETICKIYNGVVCKGCPLFPNKTPSNYGCNNNAGWNNKMFVRADLMLHQIQITNIRLERLQDISDEDCIAEGIMKGDFSNTWDKYYYNVIGDCICHKTFKTPKEAYASLIDKVSGKGTWESNPYVFVYEFKLIK
jgi:hypothetical protein